MKGKTLKTVAALTFALAVAVPASVLVVEAHVHTMSVSGVYTEYEEANSEYHWKLELRDHECTGCTYGYVEELSSEYEGHSLVLDYSTGTWYCSDCGYSD